MKKYLGLLLLLTLVSCLYYDREKIVDKHRLAGYDYRLFQSTPAWDLAKAVQDGDVAKIREIRNSNPELINYQESKYGETLLMLTIFNRNYKSFQALLENGADVNIYDKFNGSSAIIKASSRNDVKYIKLLVEYGANVNDIQVGKRRPDCSVRWTPLIAASRAGNFEVVKYLVENGADINYHNEYNETALSESVIQDNYDIAYFLLKNGANYRLPVIYRVDYSIPVEMIKTKEDTIPIYLDSFLNEPSGEFGIYQELYKRKIISFLKQKHFKSPR